MMDNFIVRYSNGKRQVVSRLQLIKFLMNYKENKALSVEPFLTSGNFFSRRFISVFNQSSRTKPQWANSVYFSRYKNISTEVK